MMFSGPKLCVVFIDLIMSTRRVTKITHILLTDKFLSVQKLYMDMVILRIEVPQVASTG